jgi:tryptophan-rich sensory protein
MRYLFSKYWLQGINYWINRLNKVPESHIPLAWITLWIVRGWANSWKATINEINRAMHCWLIQKPSKHAYSPAPRVENETTTNILEGSEAD